LIGELVKKKFDTPLPKNFGLMADHLQKGEEIENPKGTTKITRNWNEKRPINMFD